MHNKLLLLAIMTVLCQSQSINNQCCSWTSLWGSYYDYKTSFSNNHQETLEKKKKRFITRAGNYTTYLGPHSEVADRKLTWGSAFIGIGIGGGLGFQGFTMFGKFKTQEQELKA